VFDSYGHNLAHDISISIVEANVGWRREIRHPNGSMIEVRANGPTNIEHFLRIECGGIPGCYPFPENTQFRAGGDLLLWVEVTDIEAASVDQLDQLEVRGGSYFARIKGGEAHIYESTKKQPHNLSAFGPTAKKHGKWLDDRRRQRVNDVKWGKALGVKV